MDSIQNFLISTYGLVTASWLNAVLAVCGVTAACKLLFSVRGKMKMTKKRDKKRTACANAIAALETKLSTGKQVSDEEVKTITGYDINTLLSKLKKGELKPIKVLQAYQIKALEVHKKTNCLVCPIPEAEMWAKEVEASSERGPLYGLPVSLKENYGLQGTDSTGGCASYIDKIYAEDAVLVQVLKKQGAIPFVRTNIPQTMFSWETTNPIFGATVNYHDTSRGVGGSSGGEACLVSGGGSIVGLGSDAGGSIRIPCSLCGTYGFKPTVNRLSSKGTHPILKGQCLVNTGYGPIGRDMSSVVTVFRALADPIMFDIDPKVPIMPFAEQVFSDKRRLRIGYYTDDDYLTPVPAMREGVTLAVNALKAAGHEVIPWKHKDFGYRNMPLFSASVFGDQGQEILNAVRHDSLDCAMRSTVFLLKLPHWLMVFIQPVVKLVEPRLVHILKKVISMKSIADWWKLSKEFMEFREDVISEWKKAELDAVICPGFACPALPFGSADHVQGAITYTNLYNVLDFPAGSMPVRKVTSSDVDALSNYPLKGLWEKVIKKGMEGSVGLPVNVQVVTLPWRDELCLRVMTELEAALKTHPTRK